MTKLPAQHRPRSLFPEFGELFAGLPAWSSLRPMIEPNVMRLEDELTDGRYEVRAEIPGVDPAKDVDITVRDGRLTIKAERTEKKESNGRSEFSYGSFERTVTLPAGCRRRRHQGDLRQGHPDGVGRCIRTQEDREEDRDRVVELMAT